jgi:hypothetical protein
MPVETIFSVAGAMAAVGWLLLILVPKLRSAQMTAGIVIPLLLSAVYLVLIVQNISGAPGGFGSLADVSLLFSKQEILLAGWIHYLAFDLFIGAWEIRDSQRHQIPHLAMIPSLIMTFMLGPIGLLFYFAVRTAKTRKLELGGA